MVAREAEFACATAPKRNSLHWKNGTVTWGEILDWMAMPDDVKESGNYVLGTLKPTVRQHNPDDGPCSKLHRNKEAVISRSALALDLDSPDPNLPAALELVLPYAALVHTTYSSTPEQPRFRLIIPTDREMAPDEYVHAALGVMQLLGEGNFDRSSSEPERYMFRPAAHDPSTFQWWSYEGDTASVTDLLAGFNPDLSAAEAPSGALGRKRDPFSLAGRVGAFNRAYQDFQLLIEEYELPYQVAGAERWHLKGSRAVAGMGAIAPGLVYSHHANDPAYGQACTAFDLVRLHRFGELDEGISRQTPINRLPSYEAMADLASIDPRVTREMVGTDFAELMDDELENTAWLTQLQRFQNRQGTKMRDAVEAWDIIIDHDPMLRTIRWNVMTSNTEFISDPPWRTLEKGGPSVTKEDRLSIQRYMERLYKCQPSSTTVEWMVGQCKNRRFYNPVKEWLDALEWDGVPRLEECLPGVVSNDYTRMVARKSMVAAVARVFEPGCKWDHTLILYGKEGLGKTFWIEAMSRGWTAPLGPINHKDTLINLQRCWIATSDEGGNMRKADAEALKEFLTRRTDVFRQPYDIEAKTYPRRCVIWGTTNDPVFLRNQEGNRRFLIVECSKQVDFSRLTAEYIEQVWAEAVHMYRMGEVLLWMNSAESTLAGDYRAAYVEEGSAGMEGLIQEYLDTPVCGGWSEMSVDQRVQWLHDRADGFQSGDFLQDYVCTLQIFVEALDRPIGQHTRLDLLEIGKALRNLGWIPQRSAQRLGPYGPQTTYQRPDSLESIL